MLDQKHEIVDLWKHLDNVSPAGPVHKYPGIVHLGINFDLSVSQTIWLTYDFPTLMAVQSSALFNLKFENIILDLHIYIGSYVTAFSLKDDFW